MKKLWLAVTFIIAITTLVVPKAEAIQSRGIYVNGKVHYFTRGVWIDDNIFYHQEITPNSKMILPYYTAPGWGVRGSPACNPDPANRSAINAAVFDDKIFYVFSGYPQKTAGTCNYTTGTSLYIDYWDLSTNDWGALSEDDHGVSHTKLGTTQHNNTVDKKGNPTDIVGTAIVVFNNTLYVFADNATYTSTDGQNWSAHPGSLGNNLDWEPLDAITYYPPDAEPRIMIIYGESYTPGHYTNIFAADWNGQFGSDSDYHSQPVNINPHTRIDNGVILLAGTATSTNSNFAPGAKAPSLQLFLGGNGYPSFPAPQIIRTEYTYTSTGGAWASPQWTGISNDFAYMLAFPWYTNECSSDNNIQRQNLVINYFDNDKKGEATNLRSLTFTSDAMVPQNNDIPLSCTSSGGTATDTSTGDTDDEKETRRKYWTLVGVVMGSPPFAANRANETEIRSLSNVQYGQSKTGEVANSQETENSVMVSAGMSLRGGIEHVDKVKDQFDLSYKHAWESANEESTTSTVSYAFTLGTDNASTHEEDVDKLGTMGWGIFHVPNIVVQTYELYAYDYNTTTKTGTPINQAIHTTQVNQGDLSYRQVSFELANPGGPNDTIPGLLSGIQPLTKSTDFSGWKQGWESSSSNNHFKTLLGDGTVGDKKLNTITFVNGSTENVSYSTENATVTTSGETSDVDISRGTKLELGTELNGFGADLNAGYDGHFSNSVTTTTTFGSEVEAGLGMPTCYDAGCIKNLTVQPYLLQATDADAPWVPTGYNGNLPWCMHWKIKEYDTIGGTTSGVSPVGGQMSGTIVGVTPSATALSTSGTSHYSLKGGKMVWQKKNRTVTPIPMTASSFDPTLGASVKLNGFSWSSSTANGRWIRNGNIWVFRTHKSIDSDVVVMKLDFGRQTWDFNISKANLSSTLGASDGRVHSELRVNDKYEFYFDVTHKVKTNWTHKVRLVGSDANSTSLTRYHGSYDQSSRVGTAVLKGKLPANLKYFGDVSIVVNGLQYNVPLISQEGFRRALTHGKKLVVKKGNLRLTIDFGAKTWEAYFHGRIHRLLAPRETKANIQFKVGGEPWYSGEHIVLNYTSQLSYGKP